MGVAPGALTQAQVARLAERVLAIQEQVKDDPTRFFVYRDDPYGFFRDGWGIERWNPATPDTPGLTPDQCQLLDAILAGHTDIAVKSSHGQGKTFILALILLWWLYSRKCRIVTTASSWVQVEKVLWVEVKKHFDGCRMKLPGELLQTELRVAPGWDAAGLSTDNPTAFQGRHDPELLVLVDEAPGVDPKNHEAIASLATGDRNVVIKVGNPTESAGPFFDHFRANAGWFTLHFSPFRHPNVLVGREVIPGAATVKWMEKKKREWGEGSPIYASRVLGEFPDSGMRAVVPLSFVNQCMDPQHFETLREALKPSDPVLLACDVARFGEDRTAVAVRKGNVILSVDTLDGTDLMTLVAEIRRRKEDAGAQEIVVDVVGLGAGVVDRLQELGEPVIGFHSGSRASDKSLYLNRRAELWFRVRRMLEQQLIALPDDDELRADLTVPTWQTASSGKIKIESKDELKRRGYKSTDVADAVLMTFAMELGEVEIEEELVPDNRDVGFLLTEAEGLGGPMAGYGTWI